MRTLTATRHRDWRHYVPNLELVSCGDGSKPALFFRVGTTEFGEWAEFVDPMSLSWNWYQTKGEMPYVLLELCVEFINRNETMIGASVSGGVIVTTEASARYSHLLRCRAFFDPADQAHRESIEAWSSAPSPAMLFFVEENDRNRSYVSINIEPAERRGAFDKFTEAQRELVNNLANISGGFATACDFVEDTLPPVSWISPE